MRGTMSITLELQVTFTNITNKVLKEKAMGQAWSLNKTKSIKNRTKTIITSSSS